MHSPFVSRILLVSCAAVLLAAPLRAMAAAVYLTPTSLYASGEYTPESLTKKTTEVKTQKWYRVRLSATHLAWSPEEFVLRREDLGGSCFIKRVTDLHIGPYLKTPSIGTLGHGARLVVTGKTVAMGSRESWVPVSLGDSRGFVARADVVLPEDIRSGHVVLIEDNSALRSAPLADADVVASARLGQTPVLVEMSALRWGRVAIRERGDLWWPVDDGAAAAPARAVGAVARVPELARFKTSDLFAHRKIHDIASSPLIPNLKILSAEGVFRTIDGDEWEKLPQFKDSNYPVAISKTGRIYVGTLVSDDQGETFHSFLRIESVVNPLRRRWNTNPKRMRILEIDPQSADGAKLSLKVDIGLDFPVTLATSDQGQTWSAL